MNFQIATTEKVCPRSDIAAYIDGELRASEELALEVHFAHCAPCSAELNEQKKILCALDFALENGKGIELPANFTKVVVTNAESKVNGLRHPKERFNALFVCATLFLLVLLGLGSETDAVLNTFIKFTGQVFAVAGFVGHLAYDIAVGTVVILRSLSYQFVFSSTVIFAFLIAIFFISLLALSQLIFRFNRT
jgi:hypothetical protein